jgi:hypothetical protein
MTAPRSSDQLAHYDRLIATVPDLARKGDNMPYTSVNGHMTSYLDNGHLVLRLPADERAAFLERYSTTLHAAYGIVQKEYVNVPDELLADLAGLEPWFRAGFAYVAGLKPKPTTRRRP